MIAKPKVQQALLLDVSSLNTCLEVLFVTYLNAFGLKELCCTF